MRQLLTRAQTYAADRWSFVEHPRLYRAPAKRRRNWIDKAFKWGLFVMLMWWIWAPVLLALLIIAVTLMG